MIIAIMSEKINYTGMFAYPYKPHTPGELRQTTPQHSYVINNSPISRKLIEQYFAEHPDYEFDGNHDTKWTKGEFDTSSDNVFIDRYAPHLGEIPDGHAVLTDYRNGEMNETPQVSELIDLQTKIDLLTTEAQKIAS